jgi:DNA gyrase subunit A
MGRNTQGVRLIRLTNEEKLVEVEKIEVLSADDDSDPDADGGDDTVTEE